MASDYFLKLDGIKGESSDSKHKDEIEILSFSWGLGTAPTEGRAGSTGGGGAGKVSVQDFHFTMRTDTAAPKLMLACATGEHIKKATLTVRKAGASSQDYLKFNLEDVLISGIQHSGNSPNDPGERISLNFTKLSMDYKNSKSEITNSE